MKKIKIAHRALNIIAFILVTITVLNIEDYAQVNGLNKLWVWGFTMLHNLVNNNFWWLILGIFSGAAITSWILKFAYKKVSVVNSGTFVDIIIRNSSVFTYNNSKSNIYTIECMHIMTGNEGMDNPQQTIVYFFFDKPVSKLGFKIESLNNSAVPVYAEHTRDNRYFVARFEKLYKNNNNIYRIVFN